MTSEHSPTTPHAPSQDGCRAAANTAPAGLPSPHPAPCALPSSTLQGGAVFSRRRASPAAGAAGALVGWLLCCLHPLALRQPGPLCVLSGSSHARMASSCAHSRPPRRPQHSHNGRPRRSCSAGPPGAAGPARCRPTTRWLGRCWRRRRRTRWDACGTAWAELRCRPTDTVWRVAALSLAASLPQEMGAIEARLAEIEAQAPALLAQLDTRLVRFGSRPC